MGSNGGYITDANAVSPGREVRLDVQHAAPPTAAYVGVDDTLWLNGVTSANSRILTVSYRLLMPNGDIKPNQQQVTISGARGPNWVSFSLPECFILGITVTSNGIAAFPDTYVDVLISRGNPVIGVISQVLCQGYCTSQAGVSWPNGVNTTCFDAPGNIRSITGTMPAAGAEISESVPINARWRLRSIIFLLNTSATVATRFVSVVLDDSVNMVARSYSNFAHAASVNQQYSYSLGFSGSLVTVGVVAAVQLPDVPLNQFWRIRTFTSSLQPGDQYTAPQYVVEEWLDT